MPLHWPFFIHRVGDVPFENHTSKNCLSPWQKLAFHQGDHDASPNHKHHHISSKNNYFLPILSPSIALTLNQSLALWKHENPLYISHKLLITTPEPFGPTKRYPQTENIVSRPFLCMLQPAQSALLPDASENVVR